MGKVIRTTPPPKNTVESLRSYIISWTNSNPVDRWWRQKHGVAFNSKVHRDCCFEDMLFEFYEDKIYKEIEDAIPSENEVSTNKIGYEPNKRIIASKDSKNQTASEIGVTHDNMMSMLDNLYK